MSFLDVSHSETIKNNEISDSEFSLTHCIKITNLSGDFRQPLALSFAMLMSYLPPPSLPGRFCDIKPGTWLFSEWKIGSGFWTVG